MIQISSDASPPRSPKRAYVQQHAVGAHRVGDVLDRLRAQVLKADLDLAPGLVESRAGDNHATRIRELLKASRYIDAISVDVVAFDDDIAEIDADAEDDTPIFGFKGVTLGDTALMAAAQRMASTTLANSTSTPSPMTFTTRPVWASI